jgi:hypothetical protein
MHRRTSTAPSLAVHETRMDETRTASRKGRERPFSLLRRACRVHRHWQHMPSPGLASSHGGPRSRCHCAPAWPRCLGIRLGVMRSGVRATVQFRRGGVFSFWWAPVVTVYETACWLSLPANLKPPSDPPSRTSRPGRGGGSAPARPGQVRSGRAVAGTLPGLNLRP